MVGVFAPEWIEPVAETLMALGTERAWVAHGDGYDEITTTGETRVAELAERRRPHLHADAGGFWAEAPQQGRSARRRRGLQRRGAAGRARRARRAPIATRC